MERHLQCYTYQLHSKQAELWKSKNCLRFGKGYYWTKTTQYSGDKPNIAYFYCLFFFKFQVKQLSAFVTSRVIIAGSKLASLFPLLTDIPAGKVMSFSTKESQNGKNTKSLPGQQATTSTSRTSSSSLVSLGEDLIAGEL